VNFAIEREDQIMPILAGKEQERQGVMETANLMVVSARTAPKSGGKDDILTAVVYGKEIEDLAFDMEKIGVERNVEAWNQQAQNVKTSDVIVLLGARGIKPYVTNCGACGYESCETFDRAEKRHGHDFDGPNCIFKTLDLGIALGSAVKTASLLNVDNRIFYRIGVAAKRLNYMPEASIIMGIPLSARGKNPYFDRTSK
jgi:uncharacterized ferredoxin-like protein